MKKLILLATLCLVSMQVLYAQDIDADKKSGMVKVNGQPAFLLVQANKNLLQSDYSLRNLKNEELAYFKLTTEKYINATGKQDTRTVFFVTFSQSGNSCVINQFSSLSYYRALAKEIVGAGLVVDGKVSPAAEQKFVVMHKGTFLRDPNADNNKVVVNVVGSAPDKPARNAVADIAIKGNNIYNGGELVGTFKTSTEENFTLVGIYSTNDAKVAEARHENNNDNADWTVFMLSDNKQLTLLYNPKEPLEKLFKYLVEKSYL